MRNASKILVKFKKCCSRLICTNKLKKRVNLLECDKVTPSEVIVQLKITEIVHTILVYIYIYIYIYTYIYICGLGLN